jgi:CheY-like chemotaxis protein
MQDGSQSNSGQDRLNTLGWSLRELSLVLDHLEAAEKASKAPTRREFARWPFRRVSIPVVLTHPGGTQASLRLASRNISRGGISLLHTGFLHPGSACRLTIPRADGGVSDVDGIVKRCVHKRGILHEIGITFKRNVHLRDFIAFQPSAEFYSLERVTPETLRGTLLLVDHSEVDTCIARHFLRETQMEVVHVTSAEQALAKIGQGLLPAVAMCDADLADMRGAAFVRHLRESGFSTPAIITTSDAMAIMKEGGCDIPSTYLLVKPLTHDSLLRTLAECLLVRDSAEQAAASTDVAALPEHLTSRLRGMVANYARDIWARMQADDVPGALALVGKLRGFAPSLGLTAIGTAADNAMVLASAPPGEVQRALRTLIDQCQRDLGGLSGLTDDAPASGGASSRLSA